MKSNACMVKKLFKMKVLFTRGRALIFPFSVLQMNHFPAVLLDTVVGDYGDSERVDKVH